MYVIAITGLASTESHAALWLWGLALGAYFGLSEGAERALVRDLANPTERGTAFGWFHMLTGLSAIPAGLTLGLLWSAFGAPAAFGVSATLTLLATLTCWRVLREIPRS